MGRRKLFFHFSDRVKIGINSFLGGKVIHGITKRYSRSILGLALRLVSNKKQHWAPSAVPAVWFFFFSRVLLTSIIINSFHIRNLEHHLKSFLFPTTAKEWPMTRNRRAGMSLAATGAVSSLQPSQLCVYLSKDEDLLLSVVAPWSWRDDL